MTQEVDPNLDSGSLNTNEQRKFTTTANDEVATRIAAPNEGIPTKPSDTGLSTIKADLTTVEFEITPVAGQKSITVTNLDAVAVHVSLSTGVDSTFKSLGRDDEYENEDYAGSVFVIRASGTGSIQIDRALLV